MKYLDHSCFCQFALAKLLPEIQRVTDFREYFKVSLPRWVVIAEVHSQRLDIPSCPGNRKGCVKPVFPPAYPYTMRLIVIDLRATGLLVPGEVFDDLLKTTFLFNSDHGIISVVCADNFLAAHLEPDDVRVLPELESQNLHDEAWRSG